MQGLLRDHGACQARHGLGPGAGSLRSLLQGHLGHFEAGLGICNLMADRLHCLRLFDSDIDDERELRSREI